MSLVALPGMAASKIQDFQSLMSECLWQGKEPDEGGGFSFPFQNTELELEPDQRFTSQPQTPQTGCGTGGASAALGVQVLSQVGSKGRNLMWNFTFPPGIYRKEGGSKQLHWLGRWNYYFFWLHKTAAGAAVPGQVVTGRDPREGSSGGILGRDSQRGGSKDHPGREGGSGAALGALSGVPETRGRCGEQGRAGVSHSGNVGGGGAVAASLC